MSVEVALVVDDSRSARVVLTRLLQKLGLNVEQVESGEEALAYLHGAAGSHADPDVIFMDHMMPGLDGIETTKKIVAHQKTKHIPVVLYTSKEGAEYERKAADSGAIGILPKPAKPEMIQSIMNQVEKHTEKLVSVESFEEISEQLNPSLKAVATEAEEEMSEEFVENIALRVADQVIEQSMSDIKNTLTEQTQSIAELQKEMEQLKQSQLNQKQPDLSVYITTKQMEEQLNQWQSTIRGTMENMQNSLHSGLKKSLAQDIQEGVKSSMGHELALLRKELGQLKEKQPELSKDLVSQIKALAESAGAGAASTSAEKTAEKTALDVAQSQVQTEFERLYTPSAKKVQVSQLLSFVAILASVAAVALQFIPV